MPALTIAPAAPAKIRWAMRILRNPALFGQFWLLGQFCLFGAIFWTRSYRAAKARAMAW
jgi:hypothetical protein